MMIKIFFTILTTILFGFLAFAQVENLSEDKAFFQTQTEAYQRWLDHIEIGNALRVHDLSVEANQISLYLAFPFENIDSVMNAWKSVKNDFEKTNSTTLEERLFYKMASLMEIRQTMANIQIYDTYDLLKDPVFFRYIFFEDGQVQVKSSDPKSAIRTVEFRRRDYENKCATQSYDGNYDSEDIFDRIYAFAKKKYSQTNCKNRGPTITRLEQNSRILRFEAVNLCKEVLKNEGVFCPILQKMGIQCNWAKRELLTFIITHVKTENGFLLNIEIDGKFGSALYENVRRGGYENMEEDFDQEFEIYADRISHEIKESLF